MNIVTNQKQRNIHKLLEWVLRENYLGKNGELPLEQGSDI